MRVNIKCHKFAVIVSYIKSRMFNKLSEQWRIYGALHGVPLLEPQKCYTLCVTIHDKNSPCP